MFAISFDMKVDSLRQHYGDPYNPAYYEIKNLMRKHGFSWVQGSVYIAFEGDWSNFTPVVAIPQ